MRKLVALWITGMIWLVAACGYDDLDTSTTSQELVSYIPSTPTVSFGNVRVGQSGTEFAEIHESLSTVTTVQSITNNCTAYTRTIDSYYTENGFLVTHTPNVTLPQGISSPGTQETSLGVFTTFAPVARGATSGCTSIITTTGADKTYDLTGTGVAPVLDVSTTSMAFGGRRINTTSSTTSFTITNNNTGDPSSESLTITSLSLNTNSEDWVISFDTSTAIAVGGSRMGTVQFSPKAVGAQNATLTISSNDPVDASDTISLTGTGLTATVSTNPGTSLTIPSGGAGVLVNQPATNTLTVTNSATTNGTTLTVQGVTFSGTHAADFSLTSPTVPMTINPGANSIYTVQCRPSASGVRSATMTIDTDADNVPQDPSITLTCTGVKPDITATPSPMNFSAIAPGSSQNLTLQIQNAPGTFSTTLAVSSLSIGGANPGDFSFSGVSPPFNVGVGGSQNVTVTFAPTQLGSRTATLTINSNDVETPATFVTLNGTGQAPEVTLTTPANPPALNFGDVHVDTPSATQPVTVRNDGNSTLSVTSAFLTGDDPTEFFFSGTSTPTNIAPGNTATWNVGCLPTAASSPSATFRINSNDADEPALDVGLDCNGVQGVLVLRSPGAPVDFGDARIGTVNAEVFVTVENVGTAALTVTGASVGPGEYAITTPFSPSPPFVIEIGATATLGIELTPSSPGAIAGTLTVSYNTTSLPIQLTGVGTTALVGTSTGTLAFGQVVVGQTEELGFDISNTGSAELTVYNVSLSGPDAAEFFQTSGPFFPLTLDPAGSPNFATHLDYACGPFTSGTKTATLTIDTDADNAPQDPTITLTCTGAKPEITITPDPVAFGDVAPGVPTPSIVTISNGTGATVSPLTVYSLGLFGDLEFQLGSVTTPFTLPPGTSQQVTITFLPTEPGDRSATLTVGSDDQETSYVEVPVTGRGFAPEIDLLEPATGSIDFGDVTVLQTSAAQSVTIVNNGTANLSISSVGKTGAQPGDFIITGANPPPDITVTPSNTESWTVACRPNFSGLRTAALEIFSDDSDEPVTIIDLTCNGTQGSLIVESPATPIGFGAVDVGAQSGLVTVTLRNAGTGVVTINSAASVAPGVFTVVNNFASTPLFLNPDETTAIDLRFTPTADGAANGTLTVSYDATVLTAGVTGTGRAALAAASPNPLDLGSVLVGSTATTGQITLSNTGSAALNVTSASLSGTNPGDFVIVSPTFPISIPGGGGIGVTIRCTPSAVGSRSAAVQFDTDGDNLPQDPTVGLACNGVKPDITVAPSTLTYDNVAPGTPVQQTVTISNANLATTSLLSVTALTLGGTNPGDFQISPSSGFPLAPNGSQNVTVTFTPQALGFRSATLTVASTDQETPSVVVTLTGNGFAPELTMTAPATGSLAFGNVKVGTPSTSQPVTILNDGNATLTISAVTLIGANPGDFSFAGTVPANLAGAGSATWNVTCTPTATGGRSATLRLTSNDTSEGTVDVPITCTGTQGLLVVDSPATPIQFGTLDVGATSSEVVVTLRNAGTASMQVTGASVGAGFAITTALSPTPPFSLAPNATATLGIRFSPTADGLTTANLTVLNDVSSLVAELRGTGQAAIVAVAPTSVTFGDVLVGSVATTTTFAVQNSGTDTLALSATSLGGANPGDFVVVSPAFPTTVPAAGSVTVTVRCTPTTAGARAASLTVDTDADNVPQDPVVPLTCNGVKPDIIVAPPNLTFVGGSPGTPEQLEVTVSNASGATSALLSVSSLAISGTDAAEFTVSPPDPFTLAPGASRVLTVTFTPAGFGARSASLTIASDDQETPSTVVPLTGSGSAPEISVTPVGASIAFGSVNVGATGAATSIVITNTGNEDLDVTGVLVTGAQASQFLVTGPATPATLAASDDETWTVACKPTSGGAKAATLEIHSTDTDETTITYSLTCTGTVALLARTSPVGTPVTFTSTRMGESSSEVTVIFENTGNGPLTITGAVASPAEFMITTPFAQALPFVVPPGGVATLGVVFTPSATGDLDGTLDINWDATSLSVPLRGPGRIALASITPIANLDGEVDLGATCVGQARVVPVRIQNIGTAPFDVISAVTTGDAFSVESISLTALAPGASLTMDLTVDAELGDETGTLDITTDIPSTPVQTLNLVANGIDSGLGVAPTAIAFPGTLPGDVSERQPVTVTNCEADAMEIGQVALQGGDAGDFGIVGGTIPPPPLTLAPSESTQWLVEFHPDTDGGSDATLHISHDLAVGGGVIDIPLYGFGGLGSPDAGTGPDPDAMLDPDAEPASPDAEDPGVDQQSYYACSTGTPSTGTLLVFLGAVALVRRRRRARVVR